MTDPGAWVGVSALRLLPAALACWAAAFLAVAGDAAAVLATAAAAWALAGVAGAAALLLTGRRGRAAGLVPVFLLPVAAAALVLTATAAGMGPRSPAAFTAAAESGRAVTLELVATGRVVDGRLPADAVSVEVAGERSGLGRVPLLLFAAAEQQPARDVAIGETVAVEAVLRTAEPGDDRAWLAFARGDLRVVAPASPLLASAEGLRDSLRTVAEGFPAPGGGLLPGLAIGDTSAVGEGLARDMTRASLSHLTAVSGANCAIVVGLVMILCRAVGARRAVRIGVALAALAAFVVLVTPEPSVLRAAVMATAALAGLALGRPSAGIPLLCLSIVVLLVVDPWLARSYGFVLSVLATAGLLVLAGPIANRLAQLLPGPLALMLAVPTAAQLACQPVILLLDPALPIAGVPANILAGPAAPVATVLGLLACLALPVLPPLGWLLTAIAWLPAAWIAAVAGFFAGLPIARGPWPAGGVGMALLAGIAIATALAVLPRVHRRLQNGAAAMLAVALLAYPLVVLGDRVSDAVGRPADWRYALCDVGQGDALVVRDHGSVALVDAGPDPEALTACLDELGIGRIDLLVLTHYDADHVGGAEAVFGRVDRALLGPPAEPADERLAAALAASGAVVEFPPRGARGLLGELGWELLWPPRGQTPGNGASLVLRLAAAGECRSCLSALLLGDLGEREQTRLLAAAHPGRVDVVKVSHHGSADQAAALHAEAGAAVGLIGVGENGYGHPTEALLGMLAAASTAPYRSDLHGLILVAPGDEDGSLRVWTERRPP